MHLPVFVVMAMCTNSKYNNQHPQMPPKKTIFNNNTSTMRKHCERNAKTHFEVYRAGCEKLNITMHPRAIPQKLMGNVASCVFDCFGHERLIDPNVIVKVA